jgi:sec-independent protein translocase protein TatA
MNSTLLAFSLGPWEIGLLLIIMVFAFGPRRIPEIGKSVGEALTSFKKATREVEEETKEALPSGDSAEKQ